MNPWRALPQLVIDSGIDDRKMNNMVIEAALAVVMGEAESLPEELADIFTLQIRTRPDGTKFGILFPAGRRKRFLTGNKGRFWNWKLWDWWLWWKGGRR